MLLTDNHSIRDVLLFPHLRPEATPEQKYANKVKTILRDIGAEVSDGPGQFGLVADKDGKKHFIDPRLCTAEQLPDRLEQFYSSAQAEEGEGAKFIFVTNAPMSGNQRNKVKSHGRKIERNTAAVSGESNEDLKKQLQEIIR